LAHHSTALNDDIDPGYLLPTVYQPTFINVGFERLVNGPQSLFEIVSAFKGIEDTLDHAEHISTCQM